MSEDNDFDASPELEQFITLSLGIGLDNLQKERSLVPMLVSVANDEYAIGALSVNADEVMAAATNHVATLSPETKFYALVFNGRIKRRGAMVPAYLCYR